MTPGSFHSVPKGRKSARGTLKGTFDLPWVTHPPASTRSPAAWEKLGHTSPLLSPSRHEAHSGQRGCATRLLRDPITTHTDPILTGPLGKGDIEDLP